MLSLDILVHIGAFLFLLAYLVRDQILLRGLIILGTVFYIVYYFFMETPLWSALLWNSSFVVINLIMIGVIYSDRASFVMSEREKKLYQVFNTLSPGEFKKLLKNVRQNNPKINGYYWRNRATLWPCEEGQAQEVARILVNKL